MKRLSKAFDGKKAFIGLMNAGDESKIKIVDCMIAMEKGGASVIELGIPFSDPIAEGPIVQDSNVRALSQKGGCTTKDVFDILEMAKDKVNIPVILVTYLNPVYKYGYEEFMAKCSEVGVAGIIIPDMSFEEQGEIKSIATKNGIELVTVVATTSVDRIPMIVKDATSFIYLTSTISLTSQEIAGVVDKIKANSNLPVVLGIGIATPEEAKEYALVSDGIVANYGVVKVVEENLENAATAVEAYVKSMVNGCEGK